ncbi:DUF6864 domain-containing function [Klebsiella variicola]|uniref:DUF6864 domain-containing function n=1 Tax=Klebsiella variicola TaxID=244366 RepID=UPI0035B58B56
MSYSTTKKIIIDDCELVFSDTIYCKKDGCVSIEIEGIKIEILFAMDDSNETKTRTEVLDSKSLKITCLNYTKTIPMEQGLVTKKNIFSNGSIKYYLQFSSAIYSSSSESRKIVLLITKDIAQE